SGASHTKLQRGFMVDRSHAYRRVAAGRRDGACVAALVCALHVWNRARRQEVVYVIPVVRRLIRQSDNDFRCFARCASARVTLGVNDRVLQVDAAVGCSLRLHNGAETFGGAAPRQRRTMRWKNRLFGTCRTQPASPSAEASFSDV